MDARELERLYLALEQEGYLNEVLDAYGQIDATPQAFDRIRVEYPDAAPVEKLRLAQAQTLLDLARKYRIRPELSHRTPRPRGGKPRAEQPDPVEDG
jgi:hypothetical protein